MVVLGRRSGLPPAAAAEDWAPAFPDVGSVETMAANPNAVAMNRKVEIYIDVAAPQQASND